MVTLIEQKQTGITEAHDTLLSTDDVKEDDVLILELYKDTSSIRDQSSQTLPNDVNSRDATSDSLDDVYIQTWNHSVTLE